MIAAEIDTFKESARPFMGILTVISAAKSQKSDNPWSSLPKTKAQAPLKSAWVYNFGAAGGDAQILIFFDFKNENISSGGRANNGNTKNDTRAGANDVRIIHIGFRITD